MFNDKLKNVLSLRKMKPIELSRLSNINKGDISRYLKGEVNPKIDKVYRIAKALNVNPLYLVDLSDEMELKIDLVTLIKNKIDLIENEEKLKLIDNYIDYVMLQK